MKKLIVYLILACCFSVAIAQAPDTLWTKTYGDTLSDAAYCVQKTSDYGFIIVGIANRTMSTSASIWLLRTNSTGDTLWTKTYIDSTYNSGLSVDETYDHGFVIAGVTGPFMHRCDTWLIRTDSLGDTLWTKKFGDSPDNKINSVQETHDFGFILAGFTGSHSSAPFTDVWLIRTDSLGDTLWTKTFGGTGYDYARSIIETHDHGFMIAGYTSSYGQGWHDVWLIRTDSLGDTLWTKLYGTSGKEESNSIYETYDRGFIIAGSCSSLGGYDDVWILRTDSLGDTLWTKRFGGYYPDEGYSVTETSDLGFIITGYNSDYDVWIIRTDSLGDTLWTSRLGGNNGDIGYSVQQTADGGYIIVGSTASFGAGGNDVYLIKLAPEPGIVEEKIISIKNDNFGTTIISGPLLLPKDKKCKVFDITGRTVVPDKIKPGIYFIEVDGEITQKVVKVR